ncbi:MAG TPA: hypothetical protein VF054_09860 [Micromonosporaceae bacterium]
MYPLPFDPDRPPEQPPPPAAGHPELWRVAVRLHRHHTPPATGTDRCGACHAPWPCFGRRLAARALVLACRPTPRRTAPPPVDSPPAGTCDPGQPATC